MSGFKTTTNKEECDFFNMNGGKIIITDNNKFIDYLVKMRMSNNLNYPYVPNTKRNDRFYVLNFDFDFVPKPNSQSERELMKKEKYGEYEQKVELMDEVKKVMKKLFKGNKSKTFECIVEKNVDKENYHMIYKNIFGGIKELFYIRKFITMELEKKGHMEKYDVFDLLKGKSLRLSLFDKSGKNTNYMEYDLDMEDFVKPETKEDIKEYLENTIPLSTMNINFNENKLINNLKTSEEYQTIKYNLINVKKTIIPDEENVIDDNLSMLTTEHLSNIVEFFSQDKIINSGFFNYDNQFKLTLTLIRYCKNKKHSLKSTIQIINDEFFGKICDIDNNKIDNGKSYRENNVEIITRHFNNKIKISFGTIHYLLKQIDESYAVEFKSVLPKQGGEEKLDFYLEEYYHNNHCSMEEKEDFIIDFFENKLSKLQFPTNFDLMRIYFEKYFIYILKEDSFYHLNREYYTNKYGEIQITQKLEEYPEKGLGKFTFESKKDDKVFQQSFLKELRNKGMKKFKKFLFRPSLEKNENRNNYNMFYGYGFQEIDIDIQEEEMMNFELFLVYLKKYVCEDSDEQYEYFMSFLANIIQEPTFKPQIAAIFYSQEKGTGKSSLCKMLKKIIGDLYSFIGNIRVVVDKHSTSSHYKLLNVVEELDKKMGNDTYETIKDKIQADESNINKKFKDICEVRDYTRFIFTTNEYNSMKLDRDHRRFIVFTFKKTNDSHIIDLLNQVYEEKPNTYIRLFGEYLATYDIKFNQRKEWIDKRCGSNKIKLFLKNDSVDEFLLSMFNGELEDDTCCLIEEDEEIIVKQLNCWKLYKNNTEYTTTKPNFYKQMREKDFVIKSKSGIHKFTIDKEGLGDYLKDKLLIEDEDEIDISYEIEDDNMDSLIKQLGLDE